MQSGLARDVRAISGDIMNFLTGNIKKLYFKFLGAAFGSALITSIYSVVDMAMVGQYQGPEGTAALAVIAPVWNVIYSLGLLMGIGGSVIFATKRGLSKSKESNLQAAASALSTTEPKAHNKDRATPANEIQPESRNQARATSPKAIPPRTTSRSSSPENVYFTAAVLGSVILALISWISIILFEKPILCFFGADENLLPLARMYMKPVCAVFPLFLFNQMLAAFLRNDGNPNLATAAVLAGGIFNVFGDYFFVFTCDMGIFGAGLATAIGSAISFVMMCVHFFTKRNTLRLVRIQGFFRCIKEIVTVGFSTFFIDVAMGILTILFNRQIMKYLGSDALSVYGPVIQISTFVQCCAYSVGQASQPIISTNFGANQGARIKQTLHLALYTCAFFALFWTALSEAVPNLYTRIFMSPSQHILQIAPGIIRTYSISFLLLPFNIFSTYYFQAIMKPKAAFVVSVARGLVVSGALILFLPLVFPPDALWLSMPLTEAITAIYAFSRIKKYTAQLED